MINTAHRKEKVVKRGFTLAEVLITLGIIGVVSAMTLPTLINKYKMKTYEIGFKKEYSVMQNAINNINAEESLINCYITWRTGPSYKNKNSDCSLLRNNLIEKLQLKKIKKYSYKAVTALITDKEIVVNKSFHNGLLYETNDYYYMLKDGSVVNLALPAQS